MHTAVDYSPKGEFSLRNFQQSLQCGETKLNLKQPVNLKRQRELQEATELFYQDLVDFGK